MVGGILSPRKIQVKSKSKANWLRMRLWGVSGELSQLSIFLRLKVMILGSLLSGEFPSPSPHPAVLTPLVQRSLSPSLK